MLTIEGTQTPIFSNVENSVFNLFIETSPTLSVSIEGAFNIGYAHHIQRMKDSLDISVDNAYSFTSNSMDAYFTFDILYKNWLLDIQDKIPFFIQAGIDPYITPPVLPINPNTIETLELSWANSNFNMTARVQPTIGVGIGRMYNITHLVTARIMLRSLGIEDSDERVHKAAEILAKGDQYMHSMSADFSQNYRRYYTDLLEALDMEERHLDVLSLEESQVYTFDQDKFAFSRAWFASEDMNIGGELSLSIAPMIIYPSVPTTQLPIADDLNFTLTLQEKFSRITLQDRLYVKLEAEQSLMQYNILLLRGMIGAEVRYYPRYSRMWFALGFQDTIVLNLSNNAINNTQLLDLSAHYLVTPNFMVFGQFDTINFSLFELNIGGKIRIL